MILLCECNFKSPSRESGPTKVRWMVGPYWNMLIVTYSILLLISVLIYGVLVPRSISFFTLSIGLNLTITTFVLLTMTACRDPGIFPRHTRPLVWRLAQLKNTSKRILRLSLGVSHTQWFVQESDWTYSGQAGSFRPPKTIYCKETELLIEGYDHFCPWSDELCADCIEFMNKFTSNLINSGRALSSERRICGISSASLRACSLRCYLTVVRLR
jgi:hypothetical protein